MRTESGLTCHNRFQPLVNSLADKASSEIDVEESDMDGESDCAIPNNQEMWMRIHKYRSRRRQKRKLTNKSTNRRAFKATVL